MGLHLQQNNTQPLIMLKWHLRKIVVEDKAVTLEQNVTETILSYRLLLSQH